MPITPTPPLENVAAGQETSTAAQVAALATDGVNAAALACTEIFSVLPAVASTMLSTVTLTRAR